MNLCILYHVLTTSAADAGEHSCGYTSPMNGTMYKVNAQTGKGGLVLYAVWGFDPVDRPAHLTYDMNGGPEAQKPAGRWVPAGSWTVLDSAAPVWDGQHRFLGWSRDAGAKRPEYGPGDTAHVDGDTVLYAVWNVSYRITEGNGATSGTVGRSQSVQAISATVSGMSGSVSYEAHVSNKGWVEGASDGGWVGSANVEAVRMRLSGEIGKYYDVWYRAHVANVGWLGWAHGGEVAGSTGLGYPLEAWQVVLRPRGVGAPGSTKDHEIDSTYLGGQRLSDANARQRHVVDVARSTPSLGVGLCAGWVETVFARAGVGSFGGDACDLYNSYCRSSDLRELKVGMIVAVSTHSHTASGSRYGHVAIFVGDGKVLHSKDGGILEMPVKDWIAWYGTTVPPRWGWMGNVPLA